MVVSSQLCAVFLILCVFVFYRRQVYVKSDSSFCFESSLFLLLGVCLFDTCLIFSPYFNAPSLTRVFAVLFDVFSVLYIFSLQDYVSYQLAETKSFSMVSFIIRFGLALIVAVLPRTVSVNDGAFVFSLHSFIVGFVFLVFVVYDFCFMVFDRHFVSRNFRLGLGFLCFLVIVSFVFSVFFNMDFFEFAFALFHLWLFCSVESIKAEIDVRSGFFAFHVIYDYIRSLPGKRTNVCCVYTKGLEFDDSLTRVFMDDKKFCCFKGEESFYYVASSDYDYMYEFFKHFVSVYDFVFVMYKEASADMFPLFMDYVTRKVDIFESGRLYDFSKDILDKLRGDREVRFEIINAIREDRVEAYIQPIYDVSAKRFTSGECLCRIRRPDGSIMPPADFIFVAEKTGLITDIETIIFKSMCSCLADERIKLSHLKYLEANLSIRKGEQQDLLFEYSRIVSEYGVSSANINLEITETDSVREKSSILNNMCAMKSVGFNFSLDDFGSGESNIGYIIDMPVSVIKFDKEIMRKAVENERAYVIVSNVISMAHSLNIKVVGEGIETKEDFDVAVSMRCDFIQGYYFSEPLPIPKFIDFIVEHDVVCA